MLRLNYIFIVHLLLVLYPVSTFAGFNIASVDLFNLVRDSSGPSSVQDSDSITSIENPLLQPSTAMLGDNIASSTYDFSWLEGMGIGDFNTTLSHAMRNSPNITTVTSVTVVLETGIDLSVSINGLIDYSHTPGDETQLLFGYTIFDVDNGIALFGEAMEGGNADLLPSNGQMIIDTDFIVPADRTLIFSLTLDADNFDEDSAGIYDANGFANISIRPVPEPASALLLLLVGAHLLRKRRR